MKQKTLAVILLFASILNSACGGGGGGNVASSPVPKPTPDDATRAAEASLFALIGTEALLQLGSLVELNALRPMKAGFTSAIFECTSGSYQFIYPRSDEALGIHVGDTAELVFDNCEDPSVGATVNGPMRVVVEAVRDEHEFLRLRADFRELTLSQDEMPDIRFEVALLITSQTLDSGPKLTVEPSDTEVRFDNGRDVDAVAFQSFTLSKTLNLEEGRYAIDGWGHIKQRRFKEGNDFEFGRPLQGRFNRYPDQGELAVPITDFSMLTLTHSNGGNTVRTSVGGRSATPVADWSDLIEGFLWWFPDNDISYQATTTSRPTRSAQVVGTNLPYDGTRCISDARPISPNAPLYVQLDHPVSLGSATVMLRGEEITEWERRQITTTAEIRVKGARVEILPAERLQHSGKYRIMDNDRALDSHRQLQRALECTFTTGDDLTAKADFNHRLVISGTSINVDASPSFSTDAPIVSYEWRELSDSPSVIAQPDSARTTIHVETSQQKQALDFELTVTNARGAKQSAVYRIEALRNEAPHEAVLYYQVRTEDGEVSTTGTAGLMADIHIYFYPNDGYDRINVGVRSNRRHERHADPVDWGLFLASIYAEGEQLTIGVYENATTAGGAHNPEAPILVFGDGKANDRDQVHTGEFEIREMELDPRGRKITTLAVDFDVNIQPQNLTYAGSVRINSSLPLRTGTLSP